MLQALTWNERETSGREKKAPCDSLELISPYEATTVVAAGEFFDF